MINSRVISLTEAERLKFHLLQSGIQITAEAAEYIRSHNGDRPLTPADYPSTSGIVLVLEGDVWVNAPIEEYNPNFVSNSIFQLCVDSEGLWVDGDGFSSRAKFWMPPQFHGQTNSEGIAYSSLGFTHTDRVRISPISGCAFTCKFCDIPYEFRYRANDVNRLIELVQVALADPLQPASHVLISGGTPRPEHYGYMRALYELAAAQFPDVPIDIMMVPVGDVMDPLWLDEIGINEISVNLEVWSDDLARRLMPRKHKEGRTHYLEYLANAASVLGGHRVRSMFMLGIEPLESTLEGITEIASRGCTPVLSPFRPDPATPMRDWTVPSAEFMLDAYLAAREITQHYGVALGPSCVPCTHNTLTLPSTHRNGDAEIHHGHPRLI